MVIVNLICKKRKKTSYENVLYMNIPMEQLESVVDPINGVVRFDGQTVQFPFPVTSLQKPIKHGTQTPLEFRQWPGMQKAFKTKHFISLKY